MLEQEKNSITEAARQQMNSLGKAAWEAYRDLQNIRAAEIFANALKIAESTHDTRAIVYYRFCQGASLIEAGKLKQALTVLTPTLRDRKIEGEPEDVYRTLTRYIDIAIGLPISLATIEHSFTHTENYLRESGHYDWRHRLLYLRAVLYTARGMYHEALSAAQEGWTLLRNEHPSWTRDTHLDNVVEICLRLRDVELARKYLVEWETLENDMPKEREAKLCIRNSELARLKVEKHTAVDWARKAMLIAEQVDSEEVRFLAVCTLLRAFLFVGEVQLANNMIGRLIIMRHSERKNYLFTIHLLRGDYYLACIRQIVGMNPADSEYGLEFPLPARIADIKATCRMMVRARHAYDAALKVGQWIDEQLQCNWRQGEVSKRYAQIESIENLLERLT